MAKCRVCSAEITFALRPDSDKWQVLDPEYATVDPAPGEVVLVHLDGDWREVRAGAVRVQQPHQCANLRRGAARLRRPPGQIPPVGDYPEDMLEQAVAQAGFFGGQLLREAQASVALDGETQELGGAYTAARPRRAVDGNTPSAAWPKEPTDRQEAMLHEYDLPEPYSPLARCFICLDERDHDGVPHGEATGDHRRRVTKDYPLDQLAHACRRQGCEASPYEPCQTQRRGQEAVRPHRERPRAGYRGDGPLEPRWDDPGFKQVREWLFDHGDVLWSSTSA